MMSRIGIISLISCFITSSIFSQSSTEKNFYEDFIIQINDSVSISGTHISASKEKLVIIIAGSGPTDRNCNSNAGLNTNAFSMLADSLAKHQISSFRYDKRGIGESTKVNEYDLVFEDFVYDLKVIINHFKTIYQKIYLFGHSEGSTIAFQVAQENLPITAILSICGPSIPLDDILIDQLSKYPKLVPMAQKHINEIKNGQPLSEVNPMLKSLFRPSVVSYLASSFKANPAALIADLDLPMLIVGGSCDIQVDTSHAYSLNENAKNGEMVIVHNMGHVMKQLKNDCEPGLRAYSDPSIPINTDLLSELYSFIEQH